VVNFSDEAFIDCDFTSDINKLRDGLSHIDSRGGTALYDAVVASADKLVADAKRPKQVLILITDGEDNASSSDLEQTIRKVQQLSGPVIYYKYSTLAVHAGQHPDPLTGAVNVPVYLSSTFELTGIGTDRGWDYSRAGNPTRDRLETALAALEGGTSGHAFTSGMAAISALVAMLRAGDHLICSQATCMPARCGSSTRS
jgi:hypothetical protein